MRPNPAGQALLAQFFDGAILPIGLVAGALLPTLIAIAAFRLCKFASASVQPAGSAPRACDVLLLR